jgi:hypothetical protein
MTTLNYLLIFSAVLMFVVGTIGYVKKKWGIKVYFHVFLVIPITAFWFGFMPLMNPYASLEESVLRAIIIVTGGEIFAFFLIKITGKR